MTAINYIYTKGMKPLLFKQDAEKVHDEFSSIGNFLGNYEITRQLTGTFFKYSSNRLNKKIAGISFDNPVGLAAGFDYNGKMVGIMKYVGFGFNTVGTVTAKPYEGNKKPRLERLPKSKALLVNKGFKSEGVHAVAKRLDNPILKDVNFGVSVGSSNIPEVNTVNKAIEDYIETFSVIETLKYPKYYELNISCPNAAMNEGFFEAKNFTSLLDEINKLNIKKPIFVKMPNEKSPEECYKIVKIAMSKGINAFIFSNLVKSRENEDLDKQEIEKVKNLKGNFSGLPTRANSRSLVHYFRQKYKDEIVLVACGGIMSPQDAKLRLTEGADLIQLITGMIYEGPDLIKRILKYLDS